MTATHDCQCSQHGNWCDVHPNCACGCPAHAHGGKYGCISGRMTCRCKRYRPVPAYASVYAYAFDGRARARLAMALAALLLAACRREPPLPPHPPGWPMCGTHVEIPMPEPVIIDAGPMSEPPRAVPL